MTPPVSLKDLCARSKDSSTTTARWTAAQKSLRWFSSMVDPPVQVATPTTWPLQMFQTGHLGSASRAALGRSVHSTVLKPHPKVTISVGFAIVWKAKVRSAWWNMEQAGSGPHTRDPQLAPSAPGSKLALSGSRLWSSSVGGACVARCDAMMRSPYSLDSYLGLLSPQWQLTSSGFRHRVVVRPDTHASTRLHR